MSSSVAGELATSGRQVRLRIRKEGYDNVEVSQHLSSHRHRRNNNLFVRLSPEVAWELQNLLLLSSSPSTAGDFEGSDNSDDVDTTLESCWVLLPDDEQDREMAMAAASPSVAFLPLQITMDGSNDVDASYTIYASFNGGTIDCDDNVGTIEIPRSLLPNDMSTFPETVSVRAFSRIEYGTRVDVEPVSTEDWELLEIHSEAMERGELLNQISVVYEGQELSLLVGNRGDQIRVVVKEVRASSSTSESPIWPDIVSSGTSTSRPTPNCVLLVQNTEVVIAPKPRPSKKAPSWTSPLRLIPCDADWGETLDIFKTVFEIEELVAKPFSVLVNDADWLHNSEWARVKSTKSRTLERLVKVVTSPVVPEGNAVLHYGTRLDLKVNVYYDDVQLKPHVPRTVGPEFVKFEFVRVHDLQRQSALSWNMPDVPLSTEYTSSFGACYDEGDLRDKIPVGSLFSLQRAATAGRDRRGELMRFVPKDGDQSLKRCVLSVNPTSFHQALRSDSDDPELVQSDIKAAIRGPLRYVGTTEWMLAAVERMERFSSVVVKLFGSTGSGKSHNATMLAAVGSYRLHRPILYLNCKKLQKSSPKMAGILGELDALFRQAQDLQGAIVILDDLDSLSPNLLDNSESNSSSKMHSANPAAVDQSKVIADRISHLFDAVSSKQGISIIATCASFDSINSNLFRVSKIPVIPVTIPVMSSEEQLILLHHFISIQNCSGHRLEASNDSSVSQRLSGFLPRDLEKLALRAERVFRSNASCKSLDERMQQALHNFTPLSQMQASNRNKGTKSLHWDGIGGLFDVKEKLDLVVRNPIRYRRIYEKAKIRLPRGILLYGPPGCGKSCIVPALAQACNYPIVKVRGPEIFDKYIGASEAKVREMFERATQMAPSILFLDELEALAPRRGSDSTGVTDRVVNQLLTFLDGVEDASTGTVYIVGATSRPDKVDPAVVRPGRLERHLYLGPPKGQDEWTDLLVRVSNQWNLTVECLSALSNGSLLPMLRETHRLSPADVRAAFDTAHLHAVHRRLEETPANEIKSIEIEIEDLMHGFQETRPSLNESEAVALDAVYKPFRGKSSGYNKEESKGDVSSPLRTTFR